MVGRRTRRTERQNPANHPFWRGDGRDDGGSPKPKEEKKETPKKEEKPKEYVEYPYIEEDFRKREPSAEYAEVKRIEDLVLNFKKENVKTFVIGSGIQYGSGECIFN